MKIATERYPQLFSYEGDALPIAIQLYDKESSTSFFLSSFTLLLCMASVGTLPVYGSGTTDFDVSVRFSDMASHEFCTGQASFGRTDAGWVTVFSPIGALPVPGESDIPRITKILFVDSPTTMQLFVKSQSQKLTMISVIDAVIQAAIDCGPQAFNHIKTNIPSDSK